MEIFNKGNSRNTGKLEILTSHMLISPQNSSTRRIKELTGVPVALHWRDKDLLDNAAGQRDKNNLFSPWEAVFG